jgi:hypothetical protein
MYLITNTTRVIFAEDKDDGLMVAVWIGEGKGLCKRFYLQVLGQIKKGLDRGKRSNVAIEAAVEKTSSPWNWGSMPRPCF